jgi:hypothetical protein
MPYTINQAKKDAKIAPKSEASLGITPTTTKAKESSTNASSKTSGMKGQKENAAPIRNANVGKASKDKVAPAQESSTKGAGKSNGSKGKDKATNQAKGSKRAEAKSKAGKA